MHTVAGGALVADFGAVYAARPRVEFTQGEPGRTVVMRAGYLLDPDGQVSTLHGRQQTNLSFSYVMGPGAQTFEAFTYFGFRYLQIDDPGQALGRNQITALARHAAMPTVPMATFTSDNRMLNAVWRLTARSCLYCSQEQFVDTPTREKGQFVWDAANESEAIMRAYGDQNMSWQGLRDVARGQARYWPDGRVNAVYPNGDGARSFGTFTARYPEWVWRYYLSTGDRATTLAHYTSVTKVADWLWGTRQNTTGLLYGLGDTSNGDPVFGYDLSVAADTASNVLSVNAFTRVAQVAGLAGDTGGAALWRARAAQLTTTINAVLRRGDGTYVDGLSGEGRRAATPRRRRTRWHSPTGSCRRRTRRPSAPTWPASASTSGPTTAWSSSGRWPRRTCPTPWCTHWPTHPSRDGPTPWPPAGPSPGRPGPRAI